MILRVLCMPIPEISPEVKYFLVRFAQRFGNTDRCDLDVKEFAKQFGISDRRVSNALSILTAQDVLERSTESIGRGRPRNRYRLTNNFCKRLEFNQNPRAIFGTQYRATIQRLLRHEIRKKYPAVPEPVQSPKEELTSARAGRQPGMLSTADRLLLSVLLCHADGFGAIRDLGSSELRALTGLEPIGIKNKVKKLLDLGLIRAYVPGATSRVMFGKAKSTYFLNLHHPELLGTSTAITIFISAFIIDSENILEIHPVLDELYDHSRYKHTRDIREDGSQRVIQIDKFFLKKEQRSIAPILRQKLNLYASAMLTECWEALPEFNDKQLPLPDQNFQPELRKRLRVELQGSGKAKEDGETFPTAQHYIQLAEHLFKEAFQLACWIKHHLAEDIKDISLESMTFMILPRRVKAVNYPVDIRVALPILALPKVTSPSHGCYLNGKQICQKEADLPLSDRYKYGLLTKPSASK